MPLKGQKLSEETKQKLREWHTGRPLSESARQKLREINLGKRLSEQTKLKIGLAHKGRKSEKKGKSLSEVHKKKIQSALKGREFSETWRAKISQSLKGHPGLKGAQNPFYGKQHSEETKKIISEKRKAQGAPWMRDKPPLHHVIEAARKANLGCKRSKQFRENLSKRNILHGIKPPILIGSNNPRWQGGKSYELYTLGWTNTLKKAIRERDNYTCQVCVKYQKKPRLDIHHIDYDKTNLDPANLISLCRKCHFRTNSRRDLWQKIFIQKMQLVSIEKCTA